MKLLRLSSLYTALSMLLYAQCALSAQSIDCVRHYDQQLPFIGSATGSFHLIPQKQQGSAWLGVECKHAGEEPSPHLVGTHVECRRHIDGQARSLAELLILRPEVLEQQDALHVCVAAPKQAALSMRALDGGDTQLIFESGDTYLLRTDEELYTFSEERLVTARELADALAGHDLATAAVLLLEIEGGEDISKDWPYLSNEAAALIAETGCAVLVLNLPSTDRELDGGRTSNHKIVFSDPLRLIVESAYLADAPLGSASVRMALGDCGLFPDCAHVAELQLTAQL